MDQILTGLKGTACYIDIIHLHAKSYSEMEILVDAVLNRLMEHGVKVNISKSEFFQKSLVF